MLSYVQGRNDQCCNNNSSDITAANYLQLSCMVRTGSPSAPVVVPTQHTPLYRTVNCMCWAAFCYRTLERVHAMACDCKGPYVQSQLSHNYQPLSRVGLWRVGVLRPERVAQRTSN